jgi:hypothetical protein
LPPHPPTPFSHKGRRGRLGILMAETVDGAQGLAKNPCGHPPDPAPTKGRRGREERSMPHVSNDSTSSRCRRAAILVESDEKIYREMSHNSEMKEGALIQEQAVQATEIARRAVTLAEDKQASNIVLLDLRRLNSVADYFVICTGGSERQLRRSPKPSMRDSPASTISSRASREQPTLAGCCSTMAMWSFTFFLSNCATVTGLNGCGAKRPRSSSCNRNDIYYECQ